MATMEKKKMLSNPNHAKRERRNSSPRQENESRILNEKEVDSKALGARPSPRILVSDSHTGMEPPEVYDDVVIHYVDDAYRFEEEPGDSEAREMIAKENGIEREEHASCLERKPKAKEGVSDCATVKVSVSSQGDSPPTENDKVGRASRVPKMLEKRDFSESRTHVTKSRADHHETNKSHVKSSLNSPKKSSKSNRGSSKLSTKSISVNKSKIMEVPPRPSSESSEGVYDKPLEETKEIDISDEAPNGAQSIGSDDETVDAEENVVHEDRTSADQNIEEIKLRIEKLEEELREIAALEMSLYSVVPEHGSSAHKVHTPARRLSRLYIHACKHWTQDKRATIARNTVSGFILVAKSCGNDVPRLTFWLSNIIVLREIVTQAFGNSCQSSPATKVVESNGGGKRSEGKSSSLRRKANSSGKQMNNAGFMQFVDDWQETRTLTAALEKVESWIFSRIVESVWWQTLTPHMQPPVGGAYANKRFGRVLGPALGDQQQGSFSINLWKAAFQDAFHRLCPVRAGGHECGCLPVLARKVMDQCVTRLDVAMFNAILRESADEIPTDPVSDPIVDSKVLPIPAGDLSFGSGAQLKNSVGSWARWLTDLLGMDAGDSMKGQDNGEDDERWSRNPEPKSFPLLDTLSDLLMLPKDMLMDRSIRKEVCPLIGLSLIKRILCNFTPDEFCPDPVPGAVLEALNAESVVERRLPSDGNSVSSFPYNAAPVVYIPPSPADVAEKVGDLGEKSQLTRTASDILRGGYTSDEELDELESPLTSIIDKLPRSPVTGNGNGKRIERMGSSGGNVRYELLREIWSL